MTWILVDSDGNESEEIDDEDEAEEQKRNMELFGKDVELREVGNESESELDDEPQGDDLDAEIIEMSGGDGGNENGQDDDEDLEIIGDGGRPYVYCDNCGRLSTCAYRCPDDRCGADLAGKPFYRGGDDE